MISIMTDSGWTLATTSGRSQFFNTERVLYMNLCHHPLSRHQLTSGIMCVVPPDLAPIHYTTARFRLIISEQVQDRPGQLATSTLGARQRHYLRFL